VNITQSATQPQLIANQPLTQAVIDSGVELSFSEGGRVASYVTNPGDDPRVVMRQLQNQIDANGLELDVDITSGFDDPEQDNRLVVTHREFGSEPRFIAISSMAGVLAPEVNAPVAVSNGRDVKGRINDQLALGEGQFLTAAEGTEADGLKVIYTGGTPKDSKIPVGRVNVSQNSLIFQVGPNAGQKAAVSLQSVNTRTIGINVANESGYRNVSEVDVRTAQGAQDTIALVDKAIDDVNVVRARLGAVQKNALEANIRSLGVSREELINSESVLRDADMAVEVSTLTRNQVIMQSGMAMLSQANQSSKNVLNLLQGL
jgi:flagellin